jgi:hypothetical protein
VLGNVAVGLMVVYLLHSLRVHSEMVMGITVSEVQAL